MNTKYIALLLVAPAFLLAQLNVLELLPAKTVTVKAGGTTEAALPILKL